MIDRRWKCWNFVKYKLGKWWKQYHLLFVILITVIILLLALYICVMVVGKMGGMETWANNQTILEEKEKELKVAADTFDIKLLLPIAIIGGVFIAIFGSGCWGRRSW